MWLDKFFSNCILFTLQISSGPGKYFFFFFSLAGWGGEEVDGGRRIVVGPREDVEGDEDGVRVGEGGRLLDFEIMSLLVGAAGTDWDLALSVIPSFLPRSAHFSFFFYRFILFSLSTSSFPHFKEKDCGREISSTSMSESAHCCFFFFFCCCFCSCFFCCCCWSCCCFFFISAFLPASVVVVDVAAAPLFLVADFWGMRQRLVLLFWFHLSLVCACCETSCWRGGLSVFRPFLPHLSTLHQEPAV